jgi:phage terminase small subunit
MAKGKQGSKANRLTAKDFKFAQLILNEVNPTDAAIQCGHSNNKEGSARIAAYRLLNKPSIKTFLDNERMRLTEVRRRETEVDDIWITKKFKEILDRCMQAKAVMEYDRVAGEMRQARDEDTGELLYTFDSAGAIKAAENLAKHIGYYEADNKQKQPVIKIGAVQNIANYFFDNDQTDDKEEPPLIELPG